MDLQAKILYCSFLEKMALALPTQNFQNEACASKHGSTEMLNLKN